MIHSTMSNEFAFEDNGLGLLLITLGFCFFVMGLALKFLRDSSNRTADVRTTNDRGRTDQAAPLKGAPYQRNMLKLQSVRSIKLTDTCPICLCLFGEGKVISILPCGHGLHEQCWDMLATSDSTGTGLVNCPLCRESIL